MKTIEEAALEYARYGVEHDRDKRVFKSGVEFAQRWISVEEEPTPFGIEIIVKMENGKHAVARYSEQISVVGGHFDFDMPKVTHWRPIEYK